MKFVNELLCILVAALPVSAVISQNSDQKIFELDGYVRLLQDGIFTSDPSTFTSISIIHNRINSTWYIHESWTFYFDLRNRLFVGDQVKLFPDLIERLDESNDVFDLSVGFRDSRGIAGHVISDRLFLEYTKNSLEVRLGRQRINWGIGTIWNPNDVFNAYAFTDFDYSERPGSDALRVKYYTGFAGSVEVAVRAWKVKENAVAAFMWRFNRGNYDFQMIAGYGYEDAIIGGGWAGNLGETSFKGEMTYFIPTKQGNSGSLAFTVGVDYSFKSGLYMNNGFLYNSNGSDDAPIRELFNFNLTAKNLYPYKYSMISQWIYPISPLFSAGMAVIYSPSQSQVLFLNPTLTYSLASNVDADLIGQIVLENDEGYGSPVQALFLRISCAF